MSGLTREDLVDVDFVDAEELSADGSSTIFVGATVTSTTSITQTIQLSGVDLFRGERLEQGDRVVIAGSSAADGTYTVQSVLDIDSIQVVEPILDSVGGSMDALYSSGASRVGVDPSTLPFTTETNLQGVLEDIAVAGDNPDSLFNNLNESHELLYTQTEGLITGVLAHAPGNPSIKIREIDNYVVSFEGLSFSGRLRHFGPDGSTVVETITFNGTTRVKL
jgi:hypothetical protein